MAEQVFGFTADDIRRIRKAIDFYESFHRRPVLRRPNRPATVYGIDYVTGNLNGDLAYQGTSTLLLENDLDDSTGSVEVYGRWFAAEDGDYVGATFNPYTDQWDVDRRVCNPDDTGSDTADGGNASSGTGTGDYDGGTASAPSGNLDGGAP